MPQQVLTREDDRMAVTLFDDGTLRVVEQRSGTVWHTIPRCFQEKANPIEEVVWVRRERVWADVYISTFHAERAGQDARVTVFDAVGQRKGAFTLKLRRDRDWLEVRIEDIDDQLQSLTYPTPIRSASLVVPSEIGQWIREDHNSMSSSLSYQNCGLNMRWVGGLAEDNQRGWMVVFEDGFADSGVYRNGLCAAPIWARSMGKWERTRSCRYRFTSNGYVGMTSAFRDHAYEKRIARSLAEKMDATPALRNLLGGRIVSMFQCSTVHAENARNFFGEPSAETVARDGQVDVRITHADAAEVMRLARSWGMERGVFNLRGTFKGGYDESHPDIWPPEPKLGTVDELRAMSKHDGPYTTVLHDNYQDVYPRAKSFPEGVIRTSTGELMHGGHWHGGLCCIVCPTRQRSYAERNWQQVKTLGLAGYFIDTAACVQFYECRHPEHPMTRAEDVASKLRLMEFFKGQGLALGSENAADFGMYHLDFLENRHAHVPGRTIPLWPLVFHDSAFLARYGTEGTSGGGPASQLENFLWGYLCYYPANSLADWRTQEQRFKETLALDRFHARVGADRMVDHRFLTDDRLVERTEFSSGVAVTANFADEPRTVDGKTVAAGGYLVLG